MSVDGERARVIAIGDLNGAHGLLRDMLRGLDVIDGADRFVAPQTHLIQVGDLFNRGPDARGALLFLTALQRQAARLGSRVTVLLGNHEVMTALGNELYCTIDEYLSFATPRQRERWAQRVRTAERKLARDHPPGGPMLPLQPRMDLWKLDNVPGRAAMRRAMGRTGELGRILRRLPLAVREFGCVFCHSSISPTWARLGIDGLNQAVEAAWARAPSFYRDVPRSSILVDPKGPLWNRAFALQSTAEVRERLDTSLRRLGAERMVVGHTPTRAIPDADRHRIALRHDGRLVCIDVGLGVTSARAALVVDRTGGTEWTPQGTRVLWTHE